MWALCSAFFLVTFAALFVILSLTPEGRSVEDPVPMSIKIVRLVVWALSIVVIVVGPIAIVLGMAPVKEAALYFTLVALALFWSGICLLMLVFTGRRSAS